MLKTKRFAPKTPCLRPLIKYFWVIETREPIALNHKILPTTNIDLVFNLSAPTTYEKKGLCHRPPGRIFFSGLRSDPILMKQEGMMLDMGVAFFPAGSYPFFNIPVSEFKNLTVGIDQVWKGAEATITGRLRMARTTEERVAALEAFMLEHLDPSALPSPSVCRLLDRFRTQNTGVREFARHHGVTARTLERYFSRYVGTTPKGFLCLNRFQAALSRVLTQGNLALTNLAHDLEYYDQPHFIKEFNAFAGASPTAFVKEKRSVLQISETVTIR